LCPMSCTEILKARVSTDIKQQAKALAERDLLTESAWLKKLVVRELRTAHGAEISERETCGTSSGRKPGHGPRRTGLCDRPIFVRLKPDDRLLLDARAEARGMRPATYAAVLLRAHLRQLTPVPKDELLALKRTIGELAAIGRNINQIARVANEGGRLPSSVRDDFRGMLKVCEALRDHTKDLLRVNLKSWERGHGEDV
jgi:hypothetical protein